MCHVCLFACIYCLYYDVCVLCMFKCGVCTCCDVCFLHVGVGGLCVFDCAGAYGHQRPAVGVLPQMVSTLILRQGLSLSWNC